MVFQNAFVKILTTPFFSYRSFSHNFPSSMIIPQSTRNLLSTLRIKNNCHLEWHFVIPCTTSFLALSIDFITFSKSAWISHLELAPNSYGEKTNLKFFSMTIPSKFSELSYVRMLVSVSVLQKFLFQQLK